MAKSPSSPPRIAVIGSGGIGAFVAAQLALAGGAVTLCARTPFPELVVEAGGERRIAHPTIATDPDGERSAEWVFLATKAQDTADAAPWMARLCDARTTLVVLQNGIDQAARVKPFAGGATILPALVYIGAERIAPGHIVQHGGGKLVVPQGDAATRLASLLSGSGILVEQTPDFLTAAWIKLLGNISGNPLTALTMRRIGVIRDPEMRQLAAGLIKEAVAVGRASGARLSDRQAEAALAEISSYPAEGGTSMLYDRLAGRPLEHEYLTGAVVRAAKERGVDAPLNRAILALLSGLSEGLAASQKQDEMAARLNLASDRPLTFTT